MTVELILGDCLEVMKGMPDESVDTIITDPPHGPEFMGKDWDKGVPGIPFWTEMLRIAKPGACLMAMGGTRTYHRLASAIEDAGWRIIDMIEWLYGSGFPKSYDIGKGMDKAQGVEGEKVVSKWTERYPNGPQGNRFSVGDNPDGSRTGMPMDTLPATPEAQLWDGWGTALKPAHEPICVAYKPREGTYVENALKWGVAGLWIDGGRVPTDDNLGGGALTGSVSASEGWDRPWRHDEDAIRAKIERVKESVSKGEKLGRFPANVIHDGSNEVLRGFPETISGGANGNRAKGPYSNDRTWNVSNTPGANVEVGLPPSSGSAARFFYCAKASRSERNAGLEGMKPKWVDESRKPGLPGGNNPRNRGARYDTNHHPTVKPIALMEYLVRLTKTPTGGVVLDPFMGSGTTGIACVNEGRDFIGIEQSEEYLEIARRRIEYWQKQPRLL